FTANNPGAQAVTATITVTPEANSCIGTPSIFTITVNPLPVITFAPMPQLCHTSPPFALAQASPAGGTYSGNGIAAGMFDPAAAGIGTHMITYNYTNPVTGCSNTNTTQIIISGFLNITVTPNDPFICADNNIMLMATGASTFSWLPDSTLSSGSGSNVIASPPNTTTYTVTGQNPDGCMGTTMITVGIYYVPELMITTLPKEGCSPLDVQFGYGPVGPIDTNTFLWNFGDLSSVNNSSTLSNPTHKYIHNGVYGVYLRAHTNDGCPVTAIDTVKAFIRPHADFYNNPEVAFSDNPEMDFIDLSDNAASWNWNFGDPSSYDNNFSDIQNPSHIYSDSGSYLVQLIVASSQSCSDTITHRVIIYPEIIVYIPNAFTPDEDGRNEEFKPVITGMNENKYEFYIYDRWGNIQFATRDAKKGWDGKNNEKNCELGLYVYYIVYHSLTGEMFKLKGTVTLLR
ncbi:MAG TPA: PKD domain-containing protein, partial [Bacteroidales bacterium]|nr:PKD domain-containing protein [Bacteroidales bacterium]